MLYELFYIISAKYTQDEVDEITKKINKLLEKREAKITEHKTLGKQRLAYSVAKNKFGHQYLVRFEAEGSKLLEIQKELDLTNEVSRYLITHQIEGAKSLRVEIKKHLRKEEGPQARPIKVVAPALTEEQLEKEIEKILEEPKVL